jgi:hypothetical protein
MRDPVEAPRRRKRKLKINLDDLELAFETSPGTAEGYVDLDTGQVILLTEDIQAVHQQVREFMEDHGVGFDEALARLRLHDWEEAGARDAERIEEDPGGRYAAVPNLSSSAAYGDMQDFIETVPDAAVRDRLSEAIRRKHPFRNFGDAIGRYPDLEQAWFAFKQARTRQHLRSWLDAEGVEVDDGR